MVFASPREIVGPEHAGPASGVLNLMVGLAALSAPFVTGSLVPVIGWEAALASTALPSAAGVVGMLAVKRLRSTRYGLSPPVTRTSAPVLPGKNIVISTGIS